MDVLSVECERIGCREVRDLLGLALPTWSGCRDHGFWHEVSGEVSSLSSLE
jgi:hypothetical protein